MQRACVFVIAKCITNNYNNNLYTYQYTHIHMHMKDCVHRDKKQSFEKMFDVHRHFWFPFKAHFCMNV